MPVSFQMAMASLPVWLEGVLNKRYPRWRDLEYNDSGSALYMPPGVRLVEASLLRSFPREEIITCYPGDIHKFVGPRKRVVGVSTHNPLDVTFAAGVYPIMWPPPCRQASKCRLFLFCSTMMSHERRWYEARLKVLPRPWTAPAAKILCRVYIRQGSDLRIDVPVQPVFHSDRGRIFRDLVVHFYMQVLITRLRVGFVG